MSEEMYKKYMNFLFKPSHPDQLFYFGIFLDTSVKNAIFDGFFLTPYYWKPVKKTTKINPYFWYWQ